MRFDGHSRRLTLLAAALVVGLAGCSARRPRVTGTFSSRGGDIGTYTKTPDRCQSGGNWNFYGAVFFEKDNKKSVLDFVQDPVRGWMVKVDWPATKEMAVLGRKECSKLDIDMKVERTRNNPAGFVAGSAHFECRSPGGSTVRGDLTFTDCD